MQNGESNILIMKRLLFILFSVFSMVLYGQDYIAHMHTNYNADTSIIRKYTDEWSVLYTGSATAGNYFHLVNVNTGYMYSIDVDEDVTDMEILDDTLYYCGGLYSYWSVMNYFPIQQFLTGSVSIKRWRVTPTKMFVPKKLEVFRVTGGVHAVVVGDIVTAQRTDSYIVDFWHRAPYQMWDYAYLYTEDKECYDDIAVTDNYVVASAHVCHSSEIILRVLDKPTYVNILPDGHSGSDQIFTNCTLPACEYTTFNYSGSDHKKPGGHGVYPVCLAHTKGDHVVIGCMVEESGCPGVSAKEVKIVSGVPSIVRNICAWSNEPWDKFHNLWDIRYNPDSDTLAMLIDMKQEGEVYQGIMKLDNSSFTPFRFTYPVYQEGAYEMNSIDWGNSILLPHSSVDKVYRKMVSGIMSDEDVIQTKIWSVFLDDTECFKTQDMEEKKAYGNLGVFRLPANSGGILNISSSHYTRPVTPSSIAVDCGEINEEYSY